MYELKKNGKVFTSKFVGTEPSSYKKRIYRAAFSQRLRDTAPEHLWVPVSLLFNGDCSSFLRGKGQLLDLDHSLQLPVVPRKRMSGPGTALSWYAFVSWAGVSLSITCTIH